MSFKGGDKVRELVWIAGTLGLVCLFLLPIALQQHGIFIDDLATFNYPNAVFQARTLQKGIIPLWNPHIFAGALPFYTTLDAFAFYLPQWLVALVGESEPSDAAYHQLLLWPVLGHYLWAALGAFVMGRWGLKLSRPGASMLALVFTLSSPMLAGMVNPPMATALSWHPWLVAAVLLYANRRRMIWLVVGGIIIALSAPAWPNYTVHGFLLVFLFGAVAVIRSGLAEGKRPAAGLALGLLIMAALGFLLAAPFWWSLKEAARYAKETFEITYEFLTAGPRSVPLRYFAALFVPELFGSTNFAFIWGVAEEAKMYWCEATLPRGMLLWLPAFLASWSAVLVLFRRHKSAAELLSGNRGKKTDHWPRITDYWKKYAAWTWLSLGLILFSFFLLLGSYTPVFGFFYRLCPLFKTSYASRWHTIFIMGFSVLTGIGVTGLLEPPKGRSLATGRRVLAYIAVGTLLAGAAVLFPFGYWRKITDVDWFIRVPVIYWMICILLLLAVCFIRPPTRLGKIIVFLSLLGLLRSAWWDAYRPMGITWAPEQKSLTGPSESDLYQFEEFAAKFNRDDRWRTGYSRVFADNSALLSGGYSLLGVCVKPMLPRMYRTLEDLCVGWPYELSLPAPAVPFVGNMSTGSWWFDNPDPPSDKWDYLARSPDSKLFLFHNPDALPRIFTMDRIVKCSENEARRELINGDLKRAAFVDDEEKGYQSTVISKQAMSYEEFRRVPITDEGSGVAHFDTLQKSNQIKRIDFTDPNRITIGIEIKKPALLVVTDAWHPAWRATVNGEPVTVHRVNYLQRGIWLEEGEHEVKMKFHPPAFYRGRWLSLAGLTISLLLLGYGCFKKSGRGRGHPQSSDERDADEKTDTKS